MFNAFHSTIVAELINDYCLLMISFFAVATLHGLGQALIFKAFNYLPEDHSELLSINPLVHVNNPIAVAITGLMMLVSDWSLQNSYMGNVFHLSLFVILTSFIRRLSMFSSEDNVSWRQAAIGLSNLAFNFALCLFMAKLFNYLLLTTPIDTPIIQGAIRIIALIKSLAIIFLANEIAPLPPRDGYFVIRPFLPTSIDRWLRYTEDDFASSLFLLMMAVYCLLPLVLNLIDFLAQTPFF